MTDYSMNFQGLSGRAQKFLKEKIDDGDGKINAAERNKIAEYLNGKQELPAEYNGIREELEQFGRNFDVGAARSELFDDEAESVLLRGMSEKDRNAIDTITDFNTMKAIAEGKLEGYTPQQQAYAKALLEQSPYAREKMLEAENTDLKTQNIRLIEENTQLKAELASLQAKSSVAVEEQNLAAKAKSACDELLDGEYKSLSSKILGPINTIDSAAGTIIDTCKKVEQFATNGANPTTIEKSIKAAVGIINEKQSEIDRAKEEGRKILEQEVSNDNINSDTNENSKTAINIIHIQSLFGGGYQAPSTTSEMMKKAP